MAASRRVTCLVAALHGNHSYDKGSLLITSQVPVSRWHEVIGDMTLGDAILDRVVHRAHRIELKGASLRKRRTAPNGLTADAGE